MGNLKLKFSLPTLVRTGQEGSGWYRFLLANLNSKILVQHPDLSCALTYLNETTSLPTLTVEFDVDIDKSVNLVFRRDVLAARREGIVAELTKVLQTISEETELLNQDNLARRSLLEVARGSTMWQEPQGDRKGRWQHFYDGLKIEYLPDHPDEYWGQQQYWGDIVAACRRYPWMPTDISEPEGLLDLL